MLKNIIKKLLVITQLFYVECFLISETGNLIYSRKSNSIINLKSRFCNNISRRNLLYVSPIILNPNIVNANSDNIKKVAVFGASGYTGGDTVRNLLNKNKEVLALTRREMKIVDRENVDKNTLVIDNINQKNKIKNIIIDVMKPETLKGILKDIDAVIYCAASRPKVNNKEENKEYVEESNHVEDIGLKNVVNEIIKNRVKKLVVVSSICAKCQKNIRNEYENTDKNICEPCYNKQEGEELIKLMYEKEPELSYTIVRPGLLSPGEKRGVEEIEFNQGVSKSGIISREDLSDILVESILTDNSKSKTFEVYYKDTAQPIDMYKSLQTCKDMGKSIKECFFGEGYEKKEDFTIDKLLKNKVKGVIFPSGNEVFGDNYNDIFKKLKKDEKVTYDISVLGSPDIM